MSFEEFYEKTLFNLTCAWSWLEETVRANPYLILAAVAGLVVIWLFLRPKFQEK